MDGGDIKLPLAERVATQLAPGQWISIPLSNIVGMQGIVLLVYVSALMFVMGRSSIKPRSKPREAGGVENLAELSGDVWQEVIGYASVESFQTLAFVPQTQG